MSALDSLRSWISGLFGRSEAETDDTTVEESVDDTAAADTAADEANRPTADDRATATDPAEHVADAPAENVGATDEPEPEYKCTVCGTEVEAGRDRCPLCRSSDLVAIADITDGTAPDGTTIGPSDQTGDDHFEVGEAQSSEAAADPGGPEAPGVAAETGDGITEDGVTEDGVTEGEEAGDAEDTGAAGDVDTEDPEADDTDDPPASEPSGPGPKRTRSSDGPSPDGVTDQLKQARARGKALELHDAYWEPTDDDGYRVVLPDGERQRVDTKEAARTLLFETYGAEPTDGPPNDPV